jgi:hypothetical protein
MVATEYVSDQAGFAVGIQVKNECDLPIDTLFVRHALTLAAASYS